MLDRFRMTGGSPNHNHKEERCKDVLTYVSLVVVASVNWNVCWNISQDLESASQIKCAPSGFWVAPPVDLTRRVGE